MIRNEYGESNESIPVGPEERDMLIQRGRLEVFEAVAKALITKPSHRTPYSDKNRE